MSNSKAKGYRFEKEVEQYFIDRGISAKRSWASDGRSQGLPKEADLLVDNSWLLGCRVRKSLPKYLLPEDTIVGQVIKEDRGEKYIVIPLETFVQFLKETR